MDRIRCTFARESDGLQVSTWATAGTNKLGYAWVKASQNADAVLESTEPGIELEVIACQENDEPWVYFPHGWSKPQRDALAWDMRRAG